ncbi:MAG TPA: hypothetical protein GX694_08185, partial [Actinomycetales bacterium]|nr:hypothetical protein [Actinomycetales bacterium]
MTNPDDQSDQAQAQGPMDPQGQNPPRDQAGGPPQSGWAAMKNAPGPGSPGGPGFPGGPPQPQPQGGWNAPPQGGWNSPPQGGWNSPPQGGWNGPPQPGPGFQGAPGPGSPWSKLTPRLVDAIGGGVGLLVLAALAFGTSESRIPGFLVLLLAVVFVLVELSDVDLFSDVSTLPQRFVGGLKSFAAGPGGTPATAAPGVPGAPAAA